MKSESVVGSFAFSRSSPVPPSPSSREERDNFVRVGTVSRKKRAGNASGSRSLRRLGSMIDLPPKFKVPQRPCARERGFINIEGGERYYYTRVRRELERGGEARQVPPSLPRDSRSGDSVFTPSSGAVAFDETRPFDVHGEHRRTAEAERSTPSTTTQPPPRDFPGKVPRALSPDAIALHWVRVITPSKASR